VERTVPRVAVLLRGPRVRTNSVAVGAGRETAARVLERKPVRRRRECGKLLGKEELSVPAGSSRFSRAVEYKLDLHEVRKLQRSVLTTGLERRLLDGKMAEKDDVLLNSREVAFLLDLSPDTVNEFARRNIIPAFKKGRQWRFRKRDIASVKRQLRGVNAAA